MSYYHAFIPGFNFWYLYVPAMIGLFYLLGYKSIRVVRRDGRKKFRRLSPRFVGFLSVIASIIFGVLLCAESMNGIVQTFDNAFANDGSSPVYSLIFAGCAVGFLIMIFFGLNLFANSCGESRRVKKERRIP